MNEIEMRQILARACTTPGSLLDANFLCQAVSILNPKEPLTLPETSTVVQCLNLLQENKIGCVILVDRAGKITGIFTERDCLMKVVNREIDYERTAISEVMTKKPVCERLDTTLAFALHLMSEGGFRHLPLVDEEGYPVGILSVKDVIDGLVKSSIRALIEF